MIRRHAISALAVLAVGLFVAAPAHAGGTAGAVGVKKNANVKIKNTTATAYYVVVVPDTLQAPTTANQAKRLGAYPLSANRSVTYPVPAGPGAIYILAAGLVPKDPNALLPAWDDGPTTYNVAKGKTKNASIIAGPVIVVAP